VTAADAGVLHEQSGGNPLYIEQLAWLLNRRAEASPAAKISLSGVPPGVVASLGEELSLLSGPGRLLLEGAAVAGDPFEPELAAGAPAAAGAAGDEIPRDALPVRPLPEHRQPPTLPLPPPPLRRHR